MLLVSHSAILIQALCDECLYLKQGAVIAQGTPEHVLGLYESEIVQSLVADNAARVAGCPTPTPGRSDSVANILEVRFSGSCFSEEGDWVTGKPGTLTLTLGCAQSLDQVSVNVIITDLTFQVGETVQFMTSQRDIGWVRLESGRPEIRLTFPAVGLRPGAYRVKISLSSGPMHDILDVVEDVKLLVRDVGLGQNCLYFQPREWNLAGGSVSDLPVELEAMEQS